LLTFAGCGGGGGGEGGGGSALPVGGLPEYNWSNHFGGGTGITAARGIAVDTEGNIYITGQFEQMVNFAADFSGTETKTSDGGTDIFITKSLPAVTTAGRGVSAAPVMMLPTGLPSMLPAIFTLPVVSETL